MQLKTLVSVADKYMRWSHNSIRYEVLSLNLIATRNQREFQSALPKKKTQATART